jgi:hypothetical protein
MWGAHGVGACVCVRCVLVVVGRITGSPDHRIKTTTAPAKYHHQNDR